MQLPQFPDLRVESNNRGTFRQLQHLQMPASGEPAMSAREVALQSLRLPAVRDDLRRPAGNLDYLKDSIGDETPFRVATLNNTRVGWPKALISSNELRWLPDKVIVRNGVRETIAVSLQLRVPLKKFGLDLWRAGVRIVLHASPDTNQLRVTSATATGTSQRVHPHPFELEKRLGTLLEGPDAQTSTLQMLAASLRLEAKDIRAIDFRPVLYDPAEVTDTTESRLRPAILAITSLEGRSTGASAYQVLVDVLEDPTIVLRQSSITGVDRGRVFLRDPVSKTGDFSLRPNTSGKKLDAYLDGIELENLEAVGNRRKLRGLRVEIAQTNPLALDPPEGPPFNKFSSRTNEFAAVSAYHHIDAMMRMIEDFRFPLNEYFRDVRRPLMVVHRAKLEEGPSAYDGRAINAFVMPDVGQEGQEPWDVKMLFGLADLSDDRANPLGLAAGVRWIWHELCHVLLLASTGKGEFDFAHSAGDSLAAIMGDPESRLAKQGDKNRGVTFPFVWLSTRRHDRVVNKGWGWNGSLYERPNPKYSIRDPAGYRAEQILSSTLFRLYCAIGGSTVGPPAIETMKRWAAAHYVTYLIVRAIRALSWHGAVPTTDARMFAVELMNADIGTRKFMYSSADYGGSLITTQFVGGALHKVVRWAFEKQGLYQTPESQSPQDQEGDPEAVDIFIDDVADRKGEYDSTNDWHSARNAVWVRRAADGNPHDENPNLARKNYVYVNVANRGSDRALHPLAEVDVFVATGQATETWEAPHSQASAP